MVRAILLTTAILATTTLFAQRVLPLGDGTTGASGVYDMVEYDGQLIIGGFYATFLGHVRNNIQGWDGTNHFDYPGAFTAVPNRVNALEVFNGELVAAGNEPTLGHVGRWDGGTWQAMGSGLTARALALCVFNGELYAAGRDSMVSRWDGADWQTVGEAFNGVVNSLEVHGGELHAGGSFDHNASNTVELRRLVKWNGSAWEEVNYGLNGDVMDLHSTADGLVVAGSFTARGDGVQSLPLWTLYDGSAFSEPVYAITGATMVEAISGHPAGGFILGGDAYALWVDGDQHADIHFNTLRSVIDYDGQTLVGGSAGTSYAPVSGIGRLVEGVDRGTVDIGNIAASFMPSTNMFSNANGRPGFEAPQGDSTHTIYSASPWVVGEFESTLHSAAPEYGISETPTAGPNAEVMDADFYERYYQAWKLDQSTISAHAQQWNTGGYVMPYAIATWPGNGDVSNGEPEQLAPYADLDDDGVYEPQEGEYPLIRGDQAVYFILHSIPDGDGLHPPMELDYHVMHYAYADPSNADLYNTVFTNYRIVNRGSLDYTGVRFGAFTDFELGFDDDDLAGCDSLIGLSFVYNGDEFDDPGFGQPGYGANIPAQGVLFLNQAMTAHVSVRREGFTTSLEDAINGTFQGGPFSQPYSPLDYPTHFEYPGGAWVDQISLASPGRTTVSSAGPFTFNAGDTLCVDLAYPWARSTSGDPQNSLEALRTRAQLVKTWYNAQEWNCWEVEDVITRVDEATSTTTLQLYPNPTNNWVVVTRNELKGAARFELLDVSGRSLRTQMINGPSATVDLSGIAPGSYLVVVEDGASRYTRSLVIAR